MLSDIGSWASIIGLFLSFGTGFGLCKIISIKNNNHNKDSNQENQNSSIINKGTVNQTNSSSQ